MIKRTQALNIVVVAELLLVFVYSTRITTVHLLSFRFVLRCNLLKVDIEYKFAVCYLDER